MWSPYYGPCIELDIYPSLILSSVNCTVLEIKIEKEHDTVNGKYDPTELKKELLSGYQHEKCGPVQIVSELRSSIPYTTLSSKV